MTGMLLVQPPAPTSPTNSAQRLVASSRSPLGDISAVMATPPAITNPLSDGANSTVQASATNAYGAGVSGNAESPLTATIMGGTSIVTGLIQNTSQSLAAGIRSGHGSGIAFETNAHTVDFLLRCNGFNWIAYVTDLTTNVRARISANDLVQAYTNRNYYKLVWGTASAGDRLPRRYEICGGIVTSYGGINVPNGDSVRPVAFNEPRILIIGDSYKEGSMNNTALNNKLAEADWFAAAFGCRNPIVNGVGSTGVIANAGASNLYSFQQRQAAGDFTIARIGAVDLIYVPGSINDNNATNGGVTIPSGDATLQAAYTTLIASLMVDQPNAIIVGASHQFANGVAAVASRVAAYKAGMVAAAGGSQRVIWVDQTLFQNAADTSVIGADAVHPGGVFGTKIIGLSEAGSVIAAIRTRYGI